MKLPKRPDGPSAWLARLHAPLLRLHAALEVEALWEAVLALYQAALPVHRVTLFLGHLGQGDARYVRTYPAIDDLNEWYSARGKINPFSKFIDEHPRHPFYRFEEVLPPREQFVKTEFYQAFARPEGWDKGMSFLFWDDKKLRAMVSLYRSPRQPVFSRQEQSLLVYLQATVETAVVRVQQLHTERLARRGLEEFAREIPVGLVVLSWDVAVEFANREGIRACGLWNFGPTGARAYNPRDTFEVPEEILRLCRALREAIFARDPKHLGAGEVRRLAHPDIPAWSAQVTVLSSSVSALAAPRFLVVLDTPGQSEKGRLVAPDSLHHLRTLTPSEREIAERVLEGMSNAEIAKRLNKSVLTVKTQLNAVFRKLGVRSRARLMSKLL